MYTPDGKMPLTDDAWKKDAYNSLPGFMTTTDDSNNAKLLNIITDLGNVYKNDMLRLTDQINIEEASGSLLTNLAKEYGVVRIDSDDAFLRFEIKFNMFKNTLSPSLNSFNNMMSRLLNVPSSDFNIEQTGVKEYRITNLPWNFDSGANTDLKRELVSSVIQAISPPEFKLDYIEFERTDHSKRYRATSVGKLLTKHVRPKSMNYIKNVMYSAKRGDYTYHINNASKNVNEKHNN